MQALAEFLGGCIIVALVFYVAGPVWALIAAILVLG